MPTHTIGPAADLPPGAHRVVTIRNAQIGVFNVGGRFYALPNRCPHQFGPLCQGPGGATTACNAATGWQLAWIRHGEILTCPWHGIEFDITTGHSLTNPRLKVRTYPITVENDQLILTL